MIISPGTALLSPDSLVQFSVDFRSVTDSRVDRSLKPSVGSLGVSYTPQNRYGLRSVIIPSTLIRQFMVLAESNTEKNIETCGILGGKLVMLAEVVLLFSSVSSIHFRPKIGS